MTTKTAAYDLSIFEDRPVKSSVEQVKEPKKQKVLGFSAKGILVMGLIVTALTFLMIYGRVALTETTAEVTRAKQTLSTIENENIRLQMEIDRKMSLSNIEEYAVTQLNMGKVEQYQIETVSIGQNEEISVMKDNSDTNIFQRVYAKIMGQ